MHKLDTPTLHTVTALLSLSATFVMGVVWRTRKTYPGFSLWMCGIFSLALGAAMEIPDLLPSLWVVRVGRSAFLLGGLLLILRGLMIFRGYRSALHWEAPAAFLFLAIFGYYSLDPTQLDARLALYCSLAGTLSLATAAFTLWYRPPYFGSNDVLLSFWMLAYGVLSFVRVAHQLSSPGTWAALGILQSVDNYYTIAQMLTVQLMTLTLVSMNSQRIEHENSVNAFRLRKSERQLRSIGDSLPEGFVYQLDFRNGAPAFSYISAGVEPMTGLQPATLMQNAQPLFDLMAPASYAQYQEDEARSRREGTDYHGVLEFNLPDGRHTWWQVHASPLVFSVGITGWAGVAVDITKQKEAEAELERHRNQLEAMVENRTLELSQAKQAAEAANIAKGSFLANMSHEIRTPMNAILGLTGLLRRKRLEPEIADKLHKIEIAGKHLLSVINDILDLSKIEAGKLHLAAETLNVQQLASQVCTMVAETAHSKGLTLRTEGPALPLQIRGDLTRLTQALLNLVSNAVKFTATGSVTVRTLMESETPHDVRLRFEVADTGIGIAEDALTRLFAPFEQADVSTVRSFGGTGLGLAITKRLAQLMGGEAGVSSVLGKGSTFWFSACLAKEAHGPTSLESHVECAAEARLRNEFTGTRVLLVEDNAINQIVAQELLESVGLVCDLADDGALAVEAVSKAQPGTYGAVLMDMQMPNMDGVTATKVIRAIDTGDTLPIIAMTANAFEEDKAECLAAGMNDFITKPVAPERFYDILLKCLTEAR